MVGSQPVVLISGCSSGFGLLAAVEIARRGGTVVATLRDLQRRTALDAAARTAGVGLDVAQLDVTDSASIEACVAGVLARHGRLDCVVNNAGYGVGGTVFDLSLDELRAQLDTNFFGAVALTKACLPHFLARGTGQVIMVSSVAGLCATPGLGAYNASKHALEGLTAALRYEVAGRGVRVTSVCPGTFRTEVFAKRHTAAGAADPASPFYRHGQKMAQVVDQMVGWRAQDPQRVANLLADLVWDPRPPVRVVVGYDAQLQSRLARYLPDGVWEQVVRRVTGFG